MSLLESYRLRLKRKRLRVRALRKRRELSVVRNRTAQIRQRDVLLFSTLRNEKIRLPYFLEYYRNLGVGHFLIVDNDSDDGGREYLAEQPDVSLWTTKASYRAANYGVDWLNGLQSRYGHGHWTLVVDPDEFFVYPFCDSRPLRALTDWLDSSSVKAFPAMLLDMYPKGDLASAVYREGQDPLEVAPWFDSGNYMISKNWRFGNLWIQGGPRARMFFANEPRKAPALNKTPLVKWNRNYVYVSSTHMLLPRGLNLVYEQNGGEKPSGVLLHAKFLNTFALKAAEEMRRHEHYANSQEYKAYRKKLRENPSFWTRYSEKYINWRQLEVMGLISKGSWI